MAKKKVNVEEFTAKVVPSKPYDELTPYQRGAITYLAAVELHPRKPYDKQYVKDYRAYLKECNINLAEYIEEAEVLVKAEAVAAAYSVPDYQMYLTRTKLSEILHMEVE